MMPGNAYRIVDKVEELLGADERQGLVGVVDFYSSNKYSSAEDAGSEVAAGGGGSNGSARNHTNARGATSGKDTTSVGTSKYNGNGNVNNNVNANDSDYDTSNDNANDTSNNNDNDTSNKAPTSTRQHSYLLRWFWQIWFDLDNVFLHPSRREYLEYRLHTVNTRNALNRFLGPFVQIPYYIWLGEKRRKLSGIE